jgi:glutamate synthase (NADPH/NADH) small chain
LSCRGIFDAFFGIFNKGSSNHKEGGKVSIDSNSEKTTSPVIYSSDPADFYYMGVNVPCQSACPAYTNVPGYIRSLYEGLYSRSYELNQIVNLFPGVLGRVCSRPCEKTCRHGEPELGRPVNICYIKRAAADLRDRAEGKVQRLLPSKGKKVCIVGAGPAGLAAAHDLALLGIEVTILDALDEPGGMLRYGIPEFRLPRDILREEVDAVLGLGVALRTGVRVGRDVSVEDLLVQNDAVLIAAGCFEPRKLGVPGEDLPGVHLGLDMVMAVNSGRPPQLGSRLIVIGAGYTTFDCARLALRLGAQEVTICIRGLESDLRVTEEEVLETKREGVKIQALSVSRRVLGATHVEGVEFQRTLPGKILPTGRREAIAIEGSEFIIPADSVVVAVGQGAQPIPGPGETDERGVIKGDRSSFRSTVPGLFAAGDFMTGPTTVIEAIAAGRQVAEKIAEHLLGRKYVERAVRIEEARITDRERTWDYIPRQEMPTLSPLEDRLKTFTVEVELGFSEDTALEESRRCYLCYLHYEIDMSRCIYCRYCIDVAPRDCIKLVEEVIVNVQGAISGFVETSNWRNVNAVVIDNARCIRCGECVRVCPVDCISVSKVELVERVIEGGME